MLLCHITEFWRPQFAQRGEWREEFPACRGPHVESNKIKKLQGRLALSVLSNVTYPEIFLASRSGKHKLHSGAGKQRDNPAS